MVLHAVKGTQTRAANDTKWLSGDRRRRLSEGCHVEDWWQRSIGFKTKRLDKIVMGN
jgi:hypothetical protein